MINSMAEVNVIDITSHQGRNIDLSQVFVSMNVYESIYSNFLTAKLVYVETMDLESGLPIVGGELVNFQFTADAADEPTKYKFRVYKIDRDMRVHASEHKYMKILYLCSEEGLRNGLISMSKKLQGTPSDVVRSVLVDNLQSVKPLSVQQTANDMEVFCNFWSPMKTINYLTKNSTSGAGESSYVFFENTKGFVFKSLQGLLRQSPVQEFELDSSEFDKQVSTVNIQGYQFDTYFSMLEAQDNKLMGNTYYTTSTDYGYDTHSNQLQTYIHDDWVSPWNEVKYVPVSPGIKSSRNSHAPLLDFYNVTMKMNGDPSRMVGVVVEVNFPVLNDEDLFHPKYQGRWLVSEVNHMITREESYTQNISLWKDKFFREGGVS